MKKLFICLISIILLVGMLACTKNNASAKLSKEQQALADTFYANKEKWEIQDELFCQGFQLFIIDNDIVVTCNYGKEKIFHTNAVVSSSVVTKAYSFIVTADGISEGTEASLLNSAEIIALKKNPFNKILFLGQSGYYFDTDETKKESVESLFYQFEQ